MSTTPIATKTSEVIDLTQGTPNTLPVSENSAFGAYRRPIAVVAPAATTSLTLRQYRKGYVVAEAVEMGTQYIDTNFGLAIKILNADVCRNYLQGNRPVAAAIFEKIADKVYARGHLAKSVEWYQKSMDYQPDEIKKVLFLSKVAQVCDRANLPMQAQLFLQIAQAKLTELATAEIARCAREAQLRLLTSTEQQPSEQKSSSAQTKS